MNWDHGNLAICDTETGERRDLTTEGTWDGKPDEFTEGAVWSPDGKTLAFSWWRGLEGDLRLMSPQGGPYQVLVPGGKDGSIEPYAWSKDGRYVVGIRQKKSPPSVTNLLQIVRVEVANGVVQTVKDLPGATGTGTLSLSSDGKHIAYEFPGPWKDGKLVWERSAENKIRIVAIDGSGDQLLFDHPANYGAPHWIPATPELVFVSDRSGP